MHQSSTRRLDNRKSSDLGVTDRAQLDLPLCNKEERAVKIARPASVSEQTQHRARDENLSDGNAQLVGHGSPATRQCS